MKEFFIIINGPVKTGPVTVHRAAPDKLLQFKVIYM